MTDSTENFETEVCSRCGGSGEFSRCEMYGTMCFKCRGKKNVLTKRGAAAVAYFESLCSVKVSELAVGDVVAIGWGNGWARIDEIQADVAKGSSLIDGIMTPYEFPVINLKTNKGDLMWNKADKIIRKGQSAADKADKKRQALAFQNSLTMAGKVRKVVRA